MRVVSFAPLDRLNRGTSRRRRVPRSKEGRVVDLVEVMASLRRPLEGVYKHRGNVAEQAKRCIHTLRQLLRGAASCGLL